jgi:hypothetical protein
MRKLLLNRWQLVTDSCKLFLATINDTFKVSVWFLYYSFINFTYFLTLAFFPQVMSIGILIEVGTLIFTAWTFIRLIEVCIQIAKGEKIDSSAKTAKKSWSLLLPVLWVGLLHFFVLFGSAGPLLFWVYCTSYLISVPPLIALLVQLLLFLPIVYIIVRLSFTQFVVIDRGVKGLNALHQSSELIRGRSMEIFSRQILGVIALGFLLWVVASISFLIIGLIVGPDKFLLLMNNTSLNDPLLLGINTILDGTLKAVFMPLFLLFFAKLYVSTTRSS